MTERIQKLISAAGLMSRRAAEEAITAGRVKVNGEKANLGDKAYDSYIAVFNMNADVNVTITNPTISGYKPVDSLNEATNARGTCSSLP